MVLLQNRPFFEFFFLFNIGLENDFFDILDWENAFLSNKNKKFQKSKNWHFYKRVNPWFWSKYGRFSNIFFRHYTLGKWLLRYSRRKKTAFLAIKTRSSRIRKIEIFPKGLTHGFGQNMAIFPTFFFRHDKLGKWLFRYSRLKNQLSRQ